MKTVRIITVILCITLFWFVPIEAKSRHHTPDTALQKELEQLLTDKKVVAGIAVSYQGKTICRINAAQNFPMMSVFKLHQAMAVISRLQQDSLTLESPVSITKNMLDSNTYSPLRDKYPQGDIQMNIGELIEYSVALSDNNASNILFSLFGGPEFTHQYIKDLGCRHTQIQWTEKQMNTAHRRAYNNSTTPDDAVVLLEALANQKSDKDLQIRWLKAIMANTRTGANRLAKYLPDNHTLYHKTGTGYTEKDGTLMAINDIGFVVLPDGSHYSIAVFCTKSKMSQEDTEELIAEISKLTNEYILSWRHSYIPIFQQNALPGPLPTRIRYA